MLEFLRRLAALLVLACGPLLAAEPATLETVQTLDAARYLGAWHEIAMIPNFFQRKCVRDTRAEYAAGEGGTIVVRNRCVNAEGGMESITGTARRIDAGDPTRLQVRFAPDWLAWLPMVWGDYWVIGLAPDYSYAVVGDPSREYLWILSRTSTLDAVAYQKAVEAAVSNGFDPNRLVRTKQSL